MVILVGALVFKFARMYPEHGSRLRTFARGVHANLTEFFIWKLLRKTKRSSLPLAPVYMSCGIFSIQKRVYGVRPTNHELSERWARLGIMPFGSDAILNRFRSVSTHAFSRENFMREENGRIVMVDYGDQFLHEGTTTLSYFLHHHGNFFFLALNPTEAAIAAYELKVKAREDRMRST